MKAVIGLLVIGSWCSAALAVEAPFAFRARLMAVHQTDRRDWQQQVAAGEFEFPNGSQIVIAEDASELVKRAAADFADYLMVSMCVNASVRTEKGTTKPGLVPALTLKVQAAAKDGYTVETTAAGVAITASDARMAAQACYHLEDLMNLRQGPFLKCGKEVRAPRFKHRFTFSGFGNDVFPDVHLNAIAHAGFTGIEVWLDDYDVISQGPRQDVNDLIERAGKFGLETFFQPRNRAYVHPEDPAALAAYEQAYGNFARYYPKAYGVSFCGEVCEFPSRDPRCNGGDHRNKKPSDCGRPYPGWYPCSDWAPWAKMVSDLMHRHNPDCKFVFSTYNWGKQADGPRADLINRLPKNTVLIPTFEMFETHTKRNGLQSPVADYSLAFPGPGHYFMTEAESARQNGLELWSNCNSAGLSWDYGNIPVQPAPRQWKKKWDALNMAHARWGLCGLRENHEYGWSPSFIAELEKEVLWEGGMDFETHIRAIAARDFGAANVARALKAWDLWSVAAADYVPTDENQYGPCRIGAAYPYHFGGSDLQKGWNPPADFPMDPGAKFSICWFNFDKPIGGLGMAAVALDEAKEDLEIELFRGMVANYAAGTALFKEVKDSLAAGRREKAERMWALGLFLKCATQTALNVKLGRRAFRKGNKKEVLRIARLEYANATEALAAVDADSRLGYLASSGYTGGRRQIEWKLRKMRELYGNEVMGK